MTSEDFLKQLSESSERCQIATLASLYFTISDIALYCDRDADELRRKINYEPDSMESKAYRQGVLITSIKLRFDTCRFALAGNPQAEEEMKAFLSRQKLDENA